MSFLLVLLLGGSQSEWTGVALNSATESETN